MGDHTHTKFASPERADVRTVRATAQLIMNEEVLIESFNKIPDAVMILNEHRQVVFANRATFHLLGNVKYEDALGQRPGELLHCVHHSVEEAGCGTSEACKGCGAIAAVLLAQSGTEATRECHVKVRKDGFESTLNLRVWASPVKVGMQVYTLVIARNIEHEKQKEWLEQTFFHDMLNDAGGMKVFLNALHDGTIQSDAHTIKLLLSAASRLVDYVQMQRDLLRAEKGNYHVQTETCSVREILVSLKEYVHHIGIYKDIDLVLEMPNEDAAIRLDKSLFFRSLFNLTKNALEAARTGTVTISYHQERARHIFRIHNKQVIPEEVSRNIFYRAYSTKGTGRGIGTYSAKLFVERYLQGKVYFTSTPEEGTTFFVEIPAAGDMV